LSKIYIFFKSFFIEKIFIYKDHLIIIIWKTVFNYINANNIWNHVLLLAIFMKPFV